jgi:hypothetical protein
VALFVFFFVFGFLWHGVLLMGLYKQTSSVWRPEAEMSQYFLTANLLQLALALVFTFIFTRNYEGKGVGEGFCFGTFMGLFMGVLQVGSYPYLPIPFILAALWFFGSLLNGMIGGVVISLVYKET